MYNTQLEGNVTLKIIIKNKRMRSTESQDGCDWLEVANSNNDIIASSYGVLGAISFLEGMLLVMVALRNILKA